MSESQRSQDLMRIVSERELNAAETEELEALALAQVMFWTSSSAEQAKGLRLPDKAASGKNARLGLLPMTSKTLAQWRIRAPLPNYRSPLGEVPRTMVRRCFEYLHLKDVADGSSLVFAFLEQRKSTPAAEGQEEPAAGAPSDQPERVFRRPLPWYRSRVRALFKSLDEGTGMTEGSRPRLEWTFSPRLFAPGRSRTRTVNP